MFFEDFNYSPEVLIGNWREKRLMEEETLKEFMYRKKNNQLYIQKEKKLLETYVAPVELTIVHDGFIHYGDTVMIINTQKSRELLDLSTYNQPTALTIYLTDLLYLTEDMELRPPFRLSGTHKVEPCKRMSFTITRIDGTVNHRVVRYGDHFLIKTQPPWNLYVYSDHSRIYKKSTHYGKQPVSLEPDISVETRWFAQSLDSRFRLENEGLPIKANEPLLIKHLYTHQNLCVEDFLINSVFGPECEISAHINKTSVGLEHTSNYWSFVTGRFSDIESACKDDPAKTPINAK